MGPEELKSEVNRLLDDGKRLEAYEFLQKQLNLEFLSEARQKVIEFEEQKRMEARQLALMPPLPEDLYDEVLDLLPEQKIHAIKIVREEYGWSLADAKNAVEDIQYDRIPWPDISWFLHKDVRRLVIANKRQEAKLMMTRDLGIEVDTAEKLIEAIMTGKLPCPKAPPKYRSIDEE